MESVKINTLEFENVKRIRAVALEPSASGLTVIGGNNNQGKTSILDTIAWALGGDRYKPSNPVRDGSTIPPRIKITLSNGLIVERSGKNSSLKVTDPNGRKSGQQLLNSFVEELALNLPKFMEQPNREKANTLLQIIGVGDQLHRLEQQETELYNRRRAIGQVADQKKKFALEMPFYPDAPKEPVSALELIQRQQKILAINGENQRKRQYKAQLEEKCRVMDERRIRLELELQDLQENYRIALEDLEAARKSAEDLHDESTAQIEQDLQNIEAINIKVRANCDRERAEQEAEQHAKQYVDLTTELDKTRQQKVDLLNGAVLPLEGLSVDGGELTYHGKKWDGMSGSDQLKVATAIVRALNPRCGFVLLDKLEQMDMATMHEFGAWLQSQNLQAIATRVSTGSECTIIIEDGQIAGQELAPIPEPNWKAGVF
jgi:predicted ATP-dependent endonuclease of OLD family